MLINTVILFLQNILPTLVVATILLILLKEGSKKWLFHGIGLAVPVLIIQTYCSQYLSELFSGLGLEILYACGYLLIYLALLLLVLSQHQHTQATKQRLLASVSLLLVFSLNSTSFSWYLLNYINQVNALDSLLLGLTLGAGIGLSFAILLYFFLDWARAHIHAQAPVICLFLFAAGQLIQGIKLLAQVDLWPITPLLFNSGELLPAQSVLASLFSVLLGYHARITQLNAVIYIVAFVLPIILIKRNKHEI
jgi:high-affinity iron transporter